MFKIAICDDEAEICTQIDDILIKRHDLSEFEIATEIFYSGGRLIASLQKDSDFDLIFLDIEMPGLNGLELGRIIRNELDNQTLQIIYVSGKESYYRALFDIRPMNFLLKPFTAQEIIADVKLAMKLSSRFNDVFSYKKAGQTRRIPIKSILYFQSINREIKITTTTGTDSFYGKLKDIGAQLKDYPFLLIHKSFLVNYDHIIEFGYDHVIVSNTDYLPISQSKRQKFKAFQLEYEFAGEKNDY